jgi:hypothetical protein
VKFDIQWSEIGFAKELTTAGGENCVTAASGFRLE